MTTRARVHPSGRPRRLALSAGRRTPLRPQGPMARTHLRAAAMILATVLRAGSDPDVLRQR